MDSPGLYAARPLTKKRKYCHRAVHIMQICLAAPSILVCMSNSKRDHQTCQSVLRRNRRPGWQWEGTLIELRVSQ